MPIYCYWNAGQQAMTEHDTNTLWIAGWMWGKYPEHAATYALPQDEAEALERLDTVLAGHETTILLVSRVGGNP